MLSSWLMVHHLINRAYKTMPSQSPHSAQVGGHVEVLGGEGAPRGPEGLHPATAYLCISATWLSLSCTL